MEKDNQLIFGRKPVIEAIKSGKDIDKILIVQTLRGEFEIELRNLSKEYDFSIQRVPQEKLNRLSRNHTHQGIIALLSPIKFYKLTDLLPNILEEKKDPLILIADGIEDVRNMGAIGRSAVAFGADCLVSFVKGNAPINDVAVKTSAGALLKIPVCKELNMAETLALLGESGVRVFGSSLKAESSLGDLNFDGPVAIVIGSEQKGISKITSDYADHTFKLKQSNNIESLNVSVATGIILHHIYQTRQ